MSSTITSADLDRAKVASFDRGYKEGFEAATAGHPYGTTALDVMNAKRPGGATAGTPAPKQAGAVDWAEIAAAANARLPANARIKGQETGR